MPTPELYMLYAMIADNSVMTNKMKQLNSVGNKHHINLANQMLKIFRYTLPYVHHLHRSSIHGTHTICFFAKHDAPMTV